jgi:hypothetical protein
MKHPFHLAAFSLRQKAKEKAPKRKAAVSSLLRLQP